MVNNPRYYIEHVYLVSCKDCNEDIGRTLSGENPTNREELLQLLDEHDITFHPESVRSRKTRGICISCNREFALNSDENIRYHSVGSGQSCRGSGQPPKSSI